MTFIIIARNINGCLSAQDMPCKQPISLKADHQLTFNETPGIYWEYTDILTLILSYSYIHIQPRVTESSMQRCFIVFIKCASWEVQPCEYMGRRLSPESELFTGHSIHRYTHAKAQNQPRTCTEWNSCFWRDSYIGMSPLCMWEHKYACISLESTTKSEGVRPERHMESNVALMTISNSWYFEFIMRVIVSHFSRLAWKSA